MGAEWQHRTISLDPGQDEQIADFDAVLRGTHVAQRASSPLRKGVGSEPPPSATMTPPAAGTQQSQLSLSAALARTAGIAHVVFWFAVLVGALGVLGGIITALRSVEVCTGAATCRTEYPNLGVGVGIAAAAALQGLVVAMVASYVNVRVRYLNRSLTGHQTSDDRS